MARTTAAPRITGAKGKDLAGEIARQGVAVYLTEVHERAKDFSPAWPGVIAEFHRGEEEVFQKEGAYGGNRRWKSLQPEYAAWKEKHYPGQPLLVLTGRMKRRLVNPTGGGCIYDHGKAKLLIQSDVPVDGHDLAGIHMAPERADLPAREPFQVSSAQMWRMVGYNGGPILDWLLDGKTSKQLRLGI